MKRDCALVLETTENIVTWVLPTTILLGWKCLFSNHDKYILFSQALCHFGEHWPQTPYIIRMWTNKLKEMGDFWHDSGHPTQWSFFNVIREENNRRGLLSRLPAFFLKVSHCRCFFGNNVTDAVSIQTIYSDQHWILTKTVYQSPNTMVKSISPC